MSTWLSLGFPYLQKDKPRSLSYLVVTRTILIQGAQQIEVYDYASEKIHRFSTWAISCYKIFWVHEEHIWAQQIEWSMCIFFTKRDSKDRYGYVNPLVYSHARPPKSNHTMHVTKSERRYCDQWSSYIPQSLTQLKNQWNPWDIIQSLLLPGEMYQGNLCQECPVVLVKGVTCLLVLSPLIPITWRCRGSKSI